MLPCSPASGGRSFRVAFLLYFFAGSIVVSVDFLLLSWSDEWASEYALWVMQLALEASILFLFRPDGTHEVFLFAGLTRSPSGRFPPGLLDADLELDE